MMKKGVLLAAVLVLAGDWALAADEPKDDLSANIGLVTQVRFTKEEFAKLTSQMIEVADLLEKTEPDTAKVLREAVNQAQRAFITQEMDLVSEHLRKGLMTLAARKEQNIRAALLEVLKILRQGTLDVNQRMEMLEKWAQQLDDLKNVIKKQKDLESKSRVKTNAERLSQEMAAHAAALNAIIQEQKDLLDKASKTPEGKDGVRKLAELRDAVGELLDKQTKLNEVTAQTPIAKLPLAAEAQKELGEQNAKVHDKLKQAVGDPAVAKALADAKADPKAVQNASDKVGSAGKEMKKATEQLDKADPREGAKSQENAEADLKAAHQALSEALAKAGANTPSGKLADKQGDVGKKTDELAKAVEKTAQEAGTPSNASNLSKASKEMGQAQKKLTNQQPGKSTEHMKNALKELEDKKIELADLQRRIEEKAKDPAEQQAKQQDELANQTKDMADEVQKSDKSGNNKSPQSMQNASASMKKAGSKLSQGNSSSANQDQQKALEELEKARKDLEQAIAQERQAMQAESLAKIDEMLQKILNAQQGISASTRQVYRQAGGKDGSYGRPEQLKLGELSRGEGSLGDQTRKVHDMLKKEGTTKVFPSILTEVMADLASAQKLLSDQKAGDLTQAVQADVERSLIEMIDALRKEQSRRRKQQQQAGGGGGGGGGGKQPLVPPVAELKMLRSLQKQILSRTVVLDEQKSKNVLPGDQVKRQHDLLAERESKVKNMTSELNEKLKTQSGGFQ